MSKPNLERRIKRAYSDCRFGQLHYRFAFARTATDKPPLICFHQSPSSSHIFETFIAAITHDRAVYAVDTPGFGHSDPPPFQPEISDYAGAMLDFIDRLDYPQLDLLGYHTGALIATEVALARPEKIRKMVLVGLAAFNPEEQAQLSDKPFPLPPKADGSHLPEEWARSLFWRGQGQTMEMLWQNFCYKIKAGEKAWWGARAAIFYPSLERFSLLTQPVLAVRPKDDLWEISLRAKAVLAHAEWLDLPQYGFGLFEIAPQEIAHPVRTFLNK
jgi:pimeloyl-ACP methyl ester carboxylesterase